MLRNLVFLSTVSFVLIGCGGGGGSVDSSSLTTAPVSTSTSQTAYLIDSKIKGMKYTCGDIEDFTGTDGSFKFTKDCDVEFKVGKMKIGDMPRGMINSDKKVYPADLARVQRENTSDEKVKKLIRVMQSLDNDNNPDNGIEIYQSTHNSLENVKELDILSSNVSISEIQNILKEVNLTLKDEEEALKHYKKTLLDDLGISPLTTDIPSPSIYLNATVNENDSSGTQITKIPLDYLITGSVSNITITGTGYENFDVSNDGVITLSSNVTLDYEKISSYNLTIVITDTNSSTVSASFKVTVINQDEIYPTLTSFNSSIDENSQSETIVGTLQIQTNGSTIKTITLSGDGSDDFTIDTTGVIKIATGAIIDYETKGLYQLKATVENVNNNSSEVDIVININDLQESLVENPKVTAKLLASDGVEGDKFGNSVAIDGDYIVVGSRYNDEKGTDSGSVYVYKKQLDGSVKEIQKLIPNDGASQDYFGNSISISGNYVVIGAWGNDSNGTNNGSVYIFKNDGNDNFNQIQKLTVASENTDNKNFGYSVSLNNSYLIVGEPYGINSNEFTSGSAYIFKNDGNDNFTQIQKLTASDGINSDNFGHTVSIFENYIAIGAWGNDEIDINNGSVYIFKNDGNNNFNQIKKLTVASENTDNKNFGYSVSLNNSYLIVGEPYGINSNEFTSGAAYIFKNDGNDNFTQIQKLTASDGGKYDYFGESISIDGEYIVIGAYLDDANGTYSGSVYIFKNDGNDDFTQIKKLTSFDGTNNDWFGYSVSINSNNIVIGTKEDDDNGLDSGSAYLYDIFAHDKSYILNMNTNLTVEENTTFVADYYAESSIVSYSLSGTDSSLFNIDGTGVLSFKNPPDYENPSDSNNNDTYEINVNILDNVTQKSNSYNLNVIVKDNKIVETNKILASDGASSDYFGKTVSINGNYIVIGAPSDDDNGTDSGSAYVYKKQNDGSVKEIAKLTALDGASSDYFGKTVSINGNYIVIGAPSDDDNGTGSGSVYIFKNDGSDNFNQIQKITATDGATFDTFGGSVSINGNYIIIGAPSDDDNGTDSGSAYIFKNDGSDNFNQIQKITATDGANYDSFSYSVSISGNYVVIGAYGDDNGTDSGSAYIFKNDGNDNFTQIQKITPTDGVNYDSFGKTVSINGNYIVIGAPNVSGSYSGSAYIFRNDGNDNFTQVSKLTDLYGAANDQFGTSVSISGNYIVISAPSNDDNGFDSGSSYIFKNDGSDNFSQIMKIAATDITAFDYFGESVSIYNNNIVIGVWADDDKGGSSGSAYLYQIDPNDEN